MLLNSCTREKGLGDSGTANSPINIHYVDSSGRDIFSPFDDGYNGYWMDSVKAYDWSNGNKTLLSGLPNGVLFDQVEVFVTKISPNSNVINHYSTTVVHLKNKVDDTLITYISSPEWSPAASADKYFYNGKEVTLNLDDGAVRIVK